MEIIKILNSEEGISILKTIFVTMFTYYTNYRVNNRELKINIKFLFKVILLVTVIILCGILRYEVSYLISMICMILMISIIYSTDEIGNSVLTTVISLSINYTISYMAVIIVFILNKSININNDGVNLSLIIIIHFIILKFLSKMKKFKYGISFLQHNNRNGYLDILILNIGIIILLSTIILVDSHMSIAKDIAQEIIMCVIIMLITIQKTLQLYYKQKLLVKDLNETKEELEKKDKEIEELEAEILSFNKKSHTLVHKQKSLEYKLQEIMNKAEISAEEAAEVRERIKSIGKDLYEEKATIKLDETGIAEIDDMLKCMQAECKKNKIEFEIQLKGNIHYMTNNLISKDDLETLLADHIKNAIIAINHSDNINRSILVRLGKMDEVYGLYIYDSGIEFDTETLECLGKKPSTTHANEGGTGMGFMNTFDTLKKCKASLTIEEYNKPSKDNYTKVIIIKFDNKNEFKIKSYREKVTIKS